MKNILKFENIIDAFSPDEEMQDKFLARVEMLDKIIGKTIKKAQKEIESIMPEADDRHLNYFVCRLMQNCAFDSFKICIENAINERPFEHCAMDAFIDHTFALSSKKFKESFFSSVFKTNKMAH